MTPGNETLTKVGWGIIIAAALGVLFAGGAGAAVLLHRLTLQPGQCVAVSKTRVCAAAAPTVTITTTPTPAAAFKDGTFRVGLDIQPGTYQAVQPGLSCYWKRLSGFSGSLDDIIESDFAGQTIVTISPTDLGFDSERCGGWSRIS